MEKTLSLKEVSSNCSTSLLSFGPMIKFLKDKHSNERNTSEEHLNHLIAEISLATELDAPIEDLTTVTKYDELIQGMMNIIYPELEPGTDLYTVSAPLSNIAVYASLPYQKFFLTGNTTFQFIEGTAGAGFSELKRVMAYQLVLNNLYGLSELYNNTFIQPVIEPVSGIQKLMEVELVSEFIEVSPIGKLPKIDPALLSQLFKQIRSDSFFAEEIPLHLFTFEGILIMKVRDVTVRESIKEIKNILLDMPYFGDLKSFDNLQKQIQMLLDLPDVRISMSSLLNKNKEGTLSSVSDQQNFLFQPTYLVEDDFSTWKQIKQVFKERSSLLISTVSDSLLSLYPFLQSYTVGGTKSLIIYPMKFGNELKGIFSIVSETEGSITPQHVPKIEPVIPLFELALGKQSEKMDDEVDKVIKEQFTAVQSSVNWKFTEAARNFINQKNDGQETKIESIVFENVFPLYGSIDVRNSSVERSIALQKDLLDQLLLANAIIRKSKREINLFSLEEISYRIEKYMNIASVILFPGDEMEIQNFLDEEISELFLHLKVAVPCISEEIDNYFLSLNPNTRKMSRQCTAFEESIAMINNELVKFINHEQIKIQEIYAHYFEYFVTDGVDFNIYIGQSITPDKPFDQLFLKNLKLWQLTTLVKAAQKIRNLQHDIRVPLDTTQLILAHNKPISISFRAAERKFDVDGAYNIHYEIIKKRIDKIKIMGSSERLTQPGKIAIVFAHGKEAQEYTEYINFLKNEDLLEGAIEYYELEELPGVRGLKALRVSIKMETAELTCPIQATQYQLVG